MHEPLNVPFIQDTHFVNVANAFLERYHPSGEIPTPIEELIDLTFKVNIVPVPGLYDVHDIDGFITSDLENIYVDAAFQNRRPARYRFTLAHEFAHILLHQKVYKQLRFANIDEYKSTIAAVDEEALSQLEFQAHQLAGLILVPQDALETQFNQILAEAKAGGLCTANLPRPAQLRVEKVLARRFAVSPKVIEIRLKNDGLWGQPIRSA